MEAAKLIRNQSSAGTSEKLIAAWSALQGVAPLASIRSERDYKRLSKLADQLIDAGAGDERHPLASLLAVVGDIIAQWEDEHDEVPTAEPREVLRFLMTEHGLLQNDLGNIVSQGVLSEILSGKREISRALAKKLADRFGVLPAVFL